MQEVKIIGVGLTPFGKHLGRSLKDLASEACRSAFDDAGISAMDVQSAFVANSMAGLITGQECIRGQVMLRPLGIGDIPIINVENSCASSSTAMYLAFMAIPGATEDEWVELCSETAFGPAMRGQLLMEGVA